jgi:hypothetical protein
VSEGEFLQVASSCLEPTKYVVEYQPRVLEDLFAAAGETALGVRPDFIIKSRDTGRMLFVEVKKQAERGNAEERSYKHHTVQFYKTLEDRFGYDFHPWVTVWSEQLATLPRYTRKAKYLFEEGHYFLWVNYDPTSLCSWLRARCEEWLDD